MKEIKNLFADSLISETKKTTAKKKVCNNYKIKNFDFINCSQNERFERNIQALTLLKELENEPDRTITESEKETLISYSGWGGLTKFFDNEKTKLKIKELLTDKEYKEAESSLLTAYYTPPFLISEIYKYLEKCGFKGGNILEPCCATGNFFGLMPEKMQLQSNLYGVEIESISYKIAKYLYPDVMLKNSPFEDCVFEDNSFDVIIGNVPFGEFKVYDKKYEKLKPQIHDYFFAKALDLVKPNGLICFLTSKGTMDKKSTKFREYLFSRADLVGAIRLPNVTFRGCASTKVVTDLLILQKREAISFTSESFRNYTTVSKESADDKITINNYFLKHHRENVCGVFERTTAQFGRPDITVKPFENMTLQQSVKDIISSFATVEIDSCTDLNNNSSTIPAMEGVKNYSYAFKDGNIYYRKNSIMVVDNDIQPQSLNYYCFKAMINLRDCLYRLIDLQVNNVSDELFEIERKNLNDLYNHFVIRYGNFNSRANKKKFKKEFAQPLLNSLELLDEDGNVVGKSDIFFKKTISPEKTFTCSTSQDALIACLCQKSEVDIEFMSTLIAKSKEDIINDLIESKDIFYDPEKNKFVTNSEYLSGNIKKKLDLLTITQNPLLKYNEEELTKVKPTKLSYVDIVAQMGATWIPIHIYNQFMYELFNVPKFRQKPLDVEHVSRYISYLEFIHQHTLNTYVINGPKMYGDVTEVYGTERKSCYDILSDCINQRASEVFDYIEMEEGKKVSVKNRKETAKAQEKQDLIYQKWNDWIFATPERQKLLEKIYNENYNVFVPRHYNGDHLHFVGINPNITLMKHQKDAIARTIYGGNTLLAHEMGLGKSFEMIASVMEGKRLGTINKALIAVPNHLVESFSTEFLRLYPSANIAVAHPKDFSKNNRELFISRIATGNYDAIIIGHSQLIKIPVSKERQAFLIAKQMDELDQIIENLQEEKINTRAISAAKKSLETRLKKLNKKIEEQSEKERTLNFESLGVDKLVIDEAHYFKNLAFPTRLSSVAGVNSVTSEKAYDLLHKCQFLNELTDYKGIIFATGTPISNNLTEMFTMQKYLQENLLEELKIDTFDAWVAQFATIENGFEISPTGDGFQMKRRLAKFVNIPELMNIYKEIADIKLSKGVKINLPTLKLHNITCDPTEWQMEYVKNLGERAERIHNRFVTPEVDNMLKITTDGRKCGLDVRLLDNTLPDEPNSKVNICVDYVFNIYKETEKYRLAQAIFCDFSTPSKDKFNLYDDVRDKLIALGVKPDEIKFIHDYEKPEDKEKLYNLVNNGDVRVLLGSTQKLGVGSNFQRKLVAIHDLDIPYRPSDLSQRLGRMIRQGNKNLFCHLFRYTTKRTFDSYLYQILENKQRFISQIQTEDNPLRVAANTDEATLEFAEVKALISGNPLIKEKVELDRDVQKLRNLKKGYLREIDAIREEFEETIPNKISYIENVIKNIKKDLEIPEIAQYLNDLEQKKVEKENKEKDNDKSNNNADNDNNDVKNEKSKKEENKFSMKVGNVNYDNANDAANALRIAMKSCNNSDYNRNCIGNFLGLDISVQFNDLNGFSFRLSGNNHYFGNFNEFATNGLGNIARLRNEVKRMPTILKNKEEELDSYKEKLEGLRDKVNKDSTFGREEELQTKINRLIEVNRILTMD